MDRLSPPASGHDIPRCSVERDTATVSRATSGGVDGNRVRQQTEINFPSWLSSRVWPSRVWTRRSSRASAQRALAERDIETVYRLLVEHEVSQRYLAELVGQSQSEVSEILHGRQVQSYAVLERIAQGLGVSRGAMGMSYGGDGEGTPVYEDSIVLCWVSCWSHQTVHQVPPVGRLTSMVLSQNPLAFLRVFRF